MEKLNFVNTIVRPEDLESLKEVAASLFSEPETQSQSLLDTLATLGLMDLTPERRALKAATALVNRAENQGVSAFKSKVGSPFFRLSAKQRFVLMGLHRLKWSYARIADCLGIEITSVAELAWLARITLQMSMATSEKSGPGSNRVAGSGLASHSSCPEFVSSSPWTQKFLDEECTVRERTFLQNHLMVCDSCRMVLGRARKLLFDLEIAIPKHNIDESIELDSISNLADSMRARKVVGRFGFWNDLLRFLNRVDTKLLLFALGALLVFWFSTKV